MERILEIIYSSDFYGLEDWDLGDSDLLKITQLVYGRTVTKSFIFGFPAKVSLKIMAP